MIGGVYARCVGLCISVAAVAEVAEEGLRGGKRSWLAARFIVSRKKRRRGGGERETRERNKAGKGTEKRSYSLSSSNQPVS